MSVSAVSPCSAARGRPGVGLAGLGSFRQIRMTRVGQVAFEIAILALLGGLGLNASSPAYAANRTFVVQANPVSAPEGSTATVNVKLSASPGTPLTATAIFQGATDEDLTVTGGSPLSFTSSNWNTWQPVTVAAAEDADTTQGSRVLRLHKTGGNDTVPDKDVTVNEVDDDVSLTLVVSPAGYGTTTPAGTVVVDKGSGMPMAITTTSSNPRTLTNTRVTVDNNPPTTQAYSSVVAVTLPDVDADYRVKVEVQDDINTWSDPAEVMVRLQRGNPALVGTPEVLVNDYGVVVNFKTNRPCYAELHCPAKSLVKTMPAGSHPQTSFSMAFIRPEVLPNDNLTMYIHLTDEANRTFDSGDITATIAGAVKTSYISPSGTDAIGGGTSASPWRTLQYAGDRSLPGDTVILKPGVYAEPAMLTHGGYSDTARLTIQGETATTSVITGGRQIPILIHLLSAPYVTVRQLKYAYFKSRGIYALYSDHLTVEDCISFNPKGWAGGIHVQTVLSPYGLIQRNLAVGGDYGFVMGGYEYPSSHHTVVKHNTVSQTVYAAAFWIYSAADSVQTSNSFVYAGNTSYSVLETGVTSDLLTFTSDYNNLGNDVKSNADAIGLDQDPNFSDIWAQIQLEYFTPYNYGDVFSTGGKQIMAGGWFYDGVWHDYAYWTLGGTRGLRNEKGLDTNSIFADPLYVDPNQPMASWDWRLKIGSPNIGTGEGGSNIGALGVQP